MGLKCHVNGDLVLPVNYTKQCMSTVKILRKYQEHADTLSKRDCTGVLLTDSVI